MVAVAKIDTLRSLGFAGISGSYAAVGGALTVRPRIICFSNNTEGDMIVSDDGATDKLFIAAGSFKLFDLEANVNVNHDDKFRFAEGTTFSIKQSTAPVSGDFYIEVVY